MSVAKARRIIASFFVSELGYEKEAVQVLGLKKTETGWEARVMVTETNMYMKKLGYPPVFDKNVYNINLDDGLAVTSYWMGESCEGED
jgi:hypothetical protein